MLCSELSQVTSGTYIMLRSKLSQVTCSTYLMLCSELSQVTSSTYLILCSDQENTSQCLHNAKMMKCSFKTTRSFWMACVVILPLYHWWKCIKVGMMMHETIRPSITAGPSWLLVLNAHLGKTMGLTNPYTSTKISDLFSLNISPCSGLV